MVNRCKCGRGRSFDRQREDTYRQCDERNGRCLRQPRRSDHRRHARRFHCRAEQPRNDRSVESGDIWWNGYRGVPSEHGCGELHRYRDSRRYRRYEERDRSSGRCFEHRYFGNSGYAFGGRGKHLDRNGPMLRYLRKSRRRGNERCIQQRSRFGGIARNDRYFRRCDHDVHGRCYHRDGARSGDFGKRAHRDDEYRAYRLGGANPDSHSGGHAPRYRRRRT